jgi:indoleamine 2,3-dioxygenase
MPGKHREFLEHVSKILNLREFAEGNQGSAELVATFESCMKELRSWRGKHIAVVSKYIVQPARLAAHGGCEEVSRSTKGFEPGNEDDLQGTGGSALIPFLRRSRDETVGLSSPQ